MGITQSRGASGESLAAAYLELTGCFIEARNVRLAGIEIDLLAREDQTLVLVEVKFRGRRDFGGAAMALGHAQRRRLVRAAEALATRSQAVRIDVVAIELDEGGARVRHYRSAVT